MRTFARDEGGQAVVLFGLLLTVLVFSIGIAIDLGTLFVARRTLQEAADAAAVGGAIVLFDGGIGSAAETAATTDFEFNGFSIADPQITFTAHSPPWAGEPHAGEAPYVHVAITQQVRTPLLPSEGGLSTVSVSSTAGKVRTPAGYAVIALDHSSSSAFSLSSTGTVTVNNADVQVDSSSATASVKTSGSFVLGNGVAAHTVGGQSGFTNMLTGEASIADPLSGYLRPSLTGVDKGTVVVHSDATLDPGDYKQLQISCSSPCTVTFDPGTYVLLGAGLSANGYATLTGTGVFFFNTLQNYPTEQGSCGSMQIATNSNVMISAPTSGYYSGMLFFQDPSCTQTLSISANGPITSSNGSIYAPTARMKIDGSNTLTLGGQIIAKQVSIEAGASVTINYDPATVASPYLPALVE